MSVVLTESLFREVLEQFSEVYDGPGEDYPWFIDPSLKSGLLGTLASVSARQASKPIVRGGTTIAAHTEHLRWSLALANDMFSGDVATPDIRDSWKVKQVDNNEWRKLQAELRREYELLSAYVKRQRNWSDSEFLGGTIALVPHAAYHLGAIRQLVTFVKAD